ncbi:rolling circle replication-associated protein, partial [Kordiimonas lipolytica]
MKDVKESNYNFKKFIQRLNYKMDLKLKYSCVVEFQKRGAVHYHLLAYNLPFIENSKLAEIWGHGFV